MSGTVSMRLDSLSPPLQLEFPPPMLVPPNSMGTLKSAQSVVKIDLSSSVEINAVGEYGVLVT